MQKVIQKLDLFNSDFKNISIKQRIQVMKYWIEKQIKKVSTSKANDGVLSSLEIRCTYLNDKNEQYEHRILIWNTKYNKSKDYWSIFTNRLIDSGIDVKLVNKVNIKFHIDTNATSILNASKNEDVSDIISD